MTWIKRIILGVVVVLIGAPVLAVWAGALVKAIYLR